MNQPAQNIVREEPARFTIREFEGIADAAASAEIPDRLELLDGVIARMPPAFLPHVRRVNDLTYALRKALETAGSEFLVYSEAGLELDGDTLRQPDILLFRPSNESGYVQPADVLLAIEVADTTLALDLGPRKLRFARAGVPDYWVVDIEGSRVHLLADPRDGDYVAHEEQDFDVPLPVPETNATVCLA